MEKQLKILVVDDTKLNLSLITKVVASEGHLAITAQNGEEAVEKYLSEAPDIILMDVMMPVMDGFLFADEFNRDMAIAKIPVVAITSYVESPLGQPVPFDVAEYVSKPIKPKDLVVLVNKYLKKT